METNHPAVAENIAPVGGPGSDVIVEGIGCTCHSSTSAFAFEPTGRDTRTAMTSSPIPP